MDLIGWLWWVASIVFGTAFSVLWFLLSGWVSAFLQVALLIAAIYFVKYGWQRAPAEIWKRSRSFGRFFLNWVRARDDVQPTDVVQAVRVKEFGDINVSSLLSLLMIVGLLGLGAFPGR